MKTTTARRECSNFKVLVAVKLKMKGIDETLKKILTIKAIKNASQDEMQETMEGFVNDILKVLEEYLSYPEIKAVGPDYPQVRDIINALFICLNEYGFITEEELDRKFIEVENKFRREKK